MNQFGPTIPAEMGLLHRWIPRLHAILRRTGGRNNGGIHEGPSAHLYAVLDHMLLDARKELFAPLGGFQQMAKFAARRLIRHGRAAEINAHEWPPGT